MEKKKRKRLEKPQGVIVPPTINETLLSFVYAMVFSIISIAPWMELKDVIPLLFVTVTGAKYSTQAMTIGTTLVVGIIWLSCFFILWHKLEKSFDVKKSALYTLKWIAFSLAIYLAAIIAHGLIDMHLLS